MFSYSERWSHEVKISLGNKQSSYAVLTWNILNLYMKKGCKMTQMQSKIVILYSAAVGYHKSVPKLLLGYFRFCVHFIT